MQVQRGTGLKWLYFQEQGVALIRSLQSNLQIHFIFHSNAGITGVLGKKQSIPQILLKGQKKTATKNMRKKQ